MKNFKKHCKKLILLALAIAANIPILAQTVSISPTTGNVVSAKSYSSEQHLNGYGGAWIHNQLPMTLFCSDESTITDNGLMATHANNIKADAATNKLTIVSGSSVYNHMSLSLPKGYRFTSYKIVLLYSDGMGCKFSEMDSEFSKAKTSVSIPQYSKSTHTIARTSVTEGDMGNILYFKQMQTRGGLAYATIESFVITFECTSKFDAALNPDASKFTSATSCITLPFATQRLDMGSISKSTDKEYTSYKYNYENVKDLWADFTLYDNTGITDGKADPYKVGDKSIESTMTKNGLKYAGLKNNTYYLETPTEAITQNGNAIPVGYRIVGTKLKWANKNTNIKRGDIIYITDGNGNYLDENLNFTTTQVSWTYGTDGKVYNNSGSKTTYLYTQKKGLFFIHYVLSTTNDADEAETYSTDGTNLYTIKNSTTYFLSYEASKGCYNDSEPYATATVASQVSSSFTLKLYDKKGESVMQEIKVDDQTPTGELLAEDFNNDAIKFQIEGLGEGETAYVNFTLELEALNPYIDKMDVVCKQPSGETRLTNQYLADDFTLGTDGKIDFSVPKNFGTNDLQFVFEALHSKKADETYGEYGTAGENSRYHFVKSEYYDIINEDLQSHRTEAADYDYTKKISVSVAGNKAFKSNNSDEFKAGTVGSSSFFYEETRYSNATYSAQGGTWDNITVSNGDEYRPCYLVVCDETRYNIAPTTTPRHAYYAYYSSGIRVKTEEYVPTITYTTVYNGAVTTSGYDNNAYVGAKVSLRTTAGDDVDAKTGYAYIKQLTDKIASDTSSKVSGAPIDSKHILYVDASELKTVLYDKEGGEMGRMEDLQSAIGTNAIIYLPQGVTYTSQNLATLSLTGDDFVADNDIVLTDQQPFFAPYDIRMNAANEVKYTRKVTLSHNTSKWVSLIVPFTVAVDSESGQYENNEDNTSFTFYTMNTDNALDNKQMCNSHDYQVDGHFSPFTGEQLTRSNTPYLVGIDNIQEAGTDGKTLFTLRQKGSTIVRTPVTAAEPLMKGENVTATVGEESATLEHCGSYCGMAIDKNEGIFYFNKDMFVSSLNLDERYAQVFVLPFRSYYTCNGNMNALRFINISTEPGTETDGIRELESKLTNQPFCVETHDGKISVTASDDTSVVIRTLNGLTVCNMQLKAGEMQSITLPHGIYLLNGKKIKNS